MGKCNHMGMYDGCLECQKEKYEEEIEELEHIITQQQKRINKATEIWQEETGNHDMLPDLGRLIDWLLKEAGY